MFRGSLRVEVDEDGVRTGDWFEASREEPPGCGEAAPSLEESLFFFEDLFGSLPRESSRFSLENICAADQVVRQAGREAVGEVSWDSTLLRLRWTAAAEDRG